MSFPEMTAQFGNLKKSGWLQIVICFLGVYITFCTTANPCTDSPCMYGGVCTLYNATAYKCNCRVNYTGLNCEIKPQTPCYPDPCLNGATCTIIDQTFTCSCVTGYEGTKCENKAQTPCYPDPCMNDATCTIIDQAFTCSCVTGYGGHKCENKVNKGKRLYSSVVILFAATFCCYFIWGFV